MILSLYLSTVTVELMVRLSSVCLSVVVVDVRRL